MKRPTAGLFACVLCAAWVAEGQQQADTSFYGIAPRYEVRLEEGVEVTGELEAVLFVSSSARDTDFTIKLVDVYPDGRAFDVQDGVLRARYREGYEKVVLPMTPSS